MHSYIKSANIQLTGDNGFIFLDTSISFCSELNIVSGENGTGKTQVLLFLKNFIGDQAKVITDNPPVQLAAFSPKRNADKNVAAQVIASIRQQGIGLDFFDQELINSSIQEAGFTSYRSFSQYFIVSVEDLVRDGTVTYVEAVEKIKFEFDLILSRVFPGYSLNAVWENKSLSLSVIKNNQIVPIHRLSCGENEVLSLVFNLYGSRKKLDCFLIDEPELHLNWQLENGLFEFFKWFCHEFGKQIIVATHSRVIFQDNFKQNRTFLKWHGSQIIVQTELDEEIRNAVAGDAIQIINGLSLAENIIFVEDKSHEIVANTIAELKNKSIDIRIENGRSNVIKLFKVLSNEDVQNCAFLIDQDNDPVEPELTSDRRFTQLKKYCIENYFFDASLLSMIAHSANPNIEELIKASIKACNKASFKVFHQLIDLGSFHVESSLMDTLDGSEVLKKLAERLGYNKHYDLMKKYLEEAHHQGRLDELFAEITEIL
jgi:ABC-type cobalamin/Fe3+-siderophores transport system ATPase subunit